MTGKDPHQNFILVCALLTLLVQTAGTNSARQKQGKETDGKEEQIDLRCEDPSMRGLTATFATVIVKNTASVILDGFDGWALLKSFVVDLLEKLGSKNLAVCLQHIGLYM